MARGYSVSRAGPCTLALLLGVAFPCVAADGAASESKPLLQEPAGYRVYQRDRDGRADIPVALHPGRKDLSLVSARLAGLPAGAGGTFADGKLTHVPTGGPYQLHATVKVGDAERTLNVGPLFVGDLWLLAGQSNMVGYGKLAAVTPPHPKVMALGMDGRWVQAREPLHWEIDAVNPVHVRLMGPVVADAAGRAKLSRDLHQGRAQGAGLGLPFAVTLAEHAHVPIGLICCAHGGTSMAQWSPARKGEGGNSLYGSMLAQVARAGGRVKGMLWWQGESDAGSPTYAHDFPAFIAAARRDLHEPDLPFYFVQITRLVYGRPDVDPKGRNPVREVQRRVAGRVPHTAVVSAIDLELDDLGHVGTHGLQRLGRRLALVALHELYGQKGATTPDFHQVMKGPGDPPALVVRFKGVHAGGADADGLRPTRRIAGFSIRRPDGTEIPLIYEAAAGPARDAVTLKLTGPIPPGAELWYGYGLDPYCNLTDGLDMAVPAFGPVPLDGVTRRGG